MRKLIVSLVAMMGVLTLSAQTRMSDVEADIKETLAQTARVSQ